MKNPVSNKQTQQGVTLIELLMSVFLFVGLIAVMATMFNYFFDSYYFASNINRNVDQAKFAVDRMSTEIREARKSEEGAYPLEIAGDSEIAFYSDVDNDSRVERVRYFLDGTELKRGLIEPGAPPNMYDPVTESVRVISDYVKNGANPVFYYYNGDWPGDTVNNPLDYSYRLLETRLVKIELVVNVSNTEKDFTLSTKAMIRNLKSN